jgi:hypothetical protein
MSETFLVTLAIVVGVLLVVGFAGAIAFIAYWRGTNDERQRHKNRFFSLSRELLNLDEQVVLVNVSRQRTTAVSGYDTPPSGVVVIQNDAVIQIGAVDRRLLSEIESNISDDREVDATLQ